MATRDAALRPALSSGDLTCSFSAVLSPPTMSPWPQWPSPGFRSASGLHHFPSIARAKCGSPVRKPPLSSLARGGEGGREGETELGARGLHRGPLSPGAEANPGGQGTSARGARGSGWAGRGGHTGRARAPPGGQTHSDAAWDITSPGATRSRGHSGAHGRWRLCTRSKGHHGEPQAQPSARGSHAGPQRSRPGLRMSTVPRLGRPARRATFKNIIIIV